jgi:hypothetical protein
MLREGGSDLPAGSAQLPRAPPATPVIDDRKHQTALGLQPALAAEARGKAFPQQAAQTKHRGPQTPGAG